MLSATSTRLMHTKLVSGSGKSAANIVVGLGPTGLAIALEACRNDSQKRKVVAITDRETYTRDAIFRLDVDIFPYIGELVGKEVIDDYITRKLIGPKQTLNGWDFHVIQMNTFEKLLFDALQKHSNVEFICLPKRGACHMSGVDKKARAVEITRVINESEVKQLIHFKYLIGADGAYHNTANLVNAGIEYHETQHEQIHHRHARVTYCLPDGACPDKFRSLLTMKDSNEVGISKLTELGWPLASHPEVRMFVIDKRFFIAAECPLTFSSKDIDLIDEWIRTVIGSLCSNVTMENLVRLDAAVFNVPLLEANCTLVPLLSANLSSEDDDKTIHANSSYFIQAGDALRSTHYQTGSGAVVGLLQAKAFGKFMASEQTMDDLIEYHANMAAIRADNRMRVDEFVDKRRMREELQQKKQKNISDVVTDQGSEYSQPHHLHRRFNS